MSTPGVGIQILSPTGSGPQGGPEQVIFTTKYPFAKLDTQLGIDTSTDPPKGPISFQNISIFFNTDPPVSAGVPSTTLVYKFAHGYDYIPTWWVLFQNTNGTNNSAEWTYGNEGSVIFAPEIASLAELLVHVDATNVYFYVYKEWDGISAPPDIIGFTIKLRTYIFVEPIIVS